MPLVLFPGVLSGWLLGAAAWRLVSADLGVVFKVSLNPLPLAATLVVVALNALVASALWAGTQRETIATSLGERGVLAT